MKITEMNNCNLTTCRYNKDNMEFSRALAMKILEETKLLANSMRKE